MIPAIVALAIICILLLIQREREHSRWATRENAWDRERRSLSDRIQHPERAQIEPGPVEPIEPPIDAAELAYVGQEVPEFVSVGGSDAAS
jgi:hypothetical protein